MDFFWPNAVSESEECHRARPSHVGIEQIRGQRIRIARAALCEPHAVTTFKTICNTWPRCFKTSEHDSPIIWFPVVVFFVFEKKMNLKPRPPKRPVAGVTKSNTTTTVTSPEKQPGASKFYVWGQGWLLKNFLQALE